MVPLRIAFVTPEYVTELGNAGGLATYLSRMASALRAAGHRPEIITLSDTHSDTIEADGIPVHRVARSYRPVLAGRFWQALKTRAEARGYPLEAIDDYLLGAWRLSRRLSVLERHGPYDVVQSSDYAFSGLFIRQRAGRVHLVRCSSAGELFAETDGISHPFNVRMSGRLERRCLRRADGAYAPSEFVASYYRREHGLPVSVVRPPLHTSSSPVEEVAPALPPRFLIHFGQLRIRKGTDLVADALPLVWAQEPAFRMVWAGREGDIGIIEQSRAKWGRHADKVLYAGALDRAAMRGTLARATAAVLPSRVDNLPNTVLESLSLGVPVIGSAGASIDELVEDSVNGRLVPIGDAGALAQAMLQAWRLPNKDLFRRRPLILDAMTPSAAVESFVAFASPTRRP